MKMRGKDWGRENNEKEGKREGKKESSKRERERKSVKICVLPVTVSGSVTPFQLLRARPRHYFDSLHNQQKLT